MSSTFRKIAKSYQKTHRERSQPEGESRKKLGFLPKKKDYQRRAEEHHKRQNTLKALRRKALEKNPNEFYFKMIRTKMEDGVHQSEDGIPVYTPEQLHLIQSQDIQYINFKRSVELKKIERLKSNLHLLDVPGKPKNSHIVFLETKKQVKEFDAAKHLNTDPSLVERVYNRPRLETLNSECIHGHVNDTALAESAAEKSRRYAELSKRIEREHQLSILSQKMDTKKLLLDKKAKKKKISEETVNSSAQYRWVSQRKR